MKKYLLLSCFVCFAFFLTAQTTSRVEHRVSNPIADVTTHHTIPMNTVLGQPIQQVNADGMAVTIIPTGQAANAYGLYHGGKTALWADNDLNTVVFFHRAVTPGSGFVKIDISTDGGATWVSDAGPVFSPDNVVHFNARYPQGVIYNPTGNTNPDNAYAVHASATLDGSAFDGSWGGLGYGTYIIDSSAAPKQGSLTSGGNVNISVPDAMTINGDEVFLVNDVYRTDFMDSLHLIKGTWNATNNEFDFNISFIDFQTADAAQLSDGTKPYPADIKIAFSPTNSQVGYISTISFMDTASQADEGYYPVFLKTTDGGATWSNPIEVPLKDLGDLTSPDFISDAELTDWFGTLPNRQDLWFRTYFYTDLVVDANGNPHMAVPIVLGNNGGALTPFSVYDPVNGGLAGMFDIYSTDGGATWDAKFLGRLMSMRGEFGGITEDNRPQASVTADGSKVFISWLDTDTITFGSTNSNANPDIFLRGFDPIADVLTPIYNVTQGTFADGACYMGTQSHFVFGTTGTYTIPFMYQDFDPTNAASLTTFYYIHGVEITDGDFSGIESQNIVNAAVSQNYPNPFDNTTSVDVKLEKAAPVKFVVANIMGQVVHENDLGKLPAGNHTINFDGSKLTSGIYFYSVMAGNSKVTKKMNIR